MIRRLALLLPLAVGCSGGLPLYPVVGTVSYDGQPVPAGVVWFDPDPTNLPNSPQGYAYLKDGRFDTAANGRGVAGGPYLVRIEAFDGKPGNELPLGKPLFADFSRKVDLPAGKNELSFDVPKSAPPAPAKDRPKPVQPRNR